MSLNPLKELKRRLEDDSTPLPKRLRLAKNVIHSTHFPTAPKERIVAEWLENITERNGLASKDIRNVIGWLNYADDLTNDLKCRLIKVLSQYLHNNSPKNSDIHFIVKFVVNNKILVSLNSQVDDYLFITMTLLQNLRYTEMGKNNFIQKLLSNLIIYYKESTRKLDFIIKLLHGEHLETLFSYLDSEHRQMILNVCQNILFPITKKPLFASFLQNLIWKDNVDELIAEKGDKIRSVVKILSAFFIFPNGRTVKDPKFLTDFIDVFISCYHNDSQIIFAFCIMAFNCLNMNQSCFIPTMKMAAIKFEENDAKIKRSIFLKILNLLVMNEIDTSVKLNFTLGEKISKVEIKKNFTSLLQATMLGLLKLEGKPDKTTLQIIKSALKLDPSMIEQKLDVILPHIMIAKKTSNALKAYIEMLNCLMDTLFKLSRGTTFFNLILNNIKFKLEAINIEQFELKHKLKDNTDDDDLGNIQTKIITVHDILPQECIEVYGKLTSELMFRQNAGVLISLQKDFEENCLMMLDEGFVSPSIITLTEMLSAILSSFFRHNKMADHTVPQSISEEFWTSFKMFEDECIKKIGECILKLNYNPPLLTSFLKLCLSHSQLKLINLKYGNTKKEEVKVKSKNIFDCSFILPCLSGDQWNALAQMIQDDEAFIIWDNLLLIKTMAMELSNINNSDLSQNEIVSSTREYLIKRLTGNPDVIITATYFVQQLFSNIDEGQAKNLAKALVRVQMNDVNSDIFQNDAINKNRKLLNALVLEITKNIMKRFENTNAFNKSMSKSNFDIVTFLQGVNVRDYFTNLTIDNENKDLLKYIELLRNLQIYNLEERYQLVTIFSVLAVKKCCQTKKLRRNIDYLLQSLFELSPKCPDLLKIFPVDYIFSTDDKVILNLLTLSIKTTNDQSIVKSVLEVAVKKVKTNSEIVKELVEILLSKKRLSKKKPLKNLEYFNDTTFQLQCIILPIIAKEKRTITASGFRSILANLQESLHQAMLESFMHMDFSKIGSFGNDDGDNIVESLVTSKVNVAALNAIGAYSLTLLKYCEMTDVEKIKKLDCLWSGLEFFVQTAIKAIENPKSKYQHVDSSIQLLNIILRYIKKLDSHEMFQRKDVIFKQIWRSIKERLLLIFNESSKRLNNALLENISVTLKFLAELTLIENFVSQFVGDLNSMLILKKPSEILKNDDITSTELTTHRTSKYLLQHFLKANIVAPKCAALKKLMFRVCKDMKCWIQEHYESHHDNVNSKKTQSKHFIEKKEIFGEVQLTSYKVDDSICIILRIHLDMLIEIVMAAKKMPLDYRFLDAVFELQHVVHYILGCNLIDAKCEISWQSFFDLHEGCTLVLNKLLLGREELLEDRWPCYMQCYKSLILCLCDRVGTLQQIDKETEQKLAETAHSIEILTQSMCKRKAHVSRIAAYALADICTWIEKTAPPKHIRQHLENSIALLIQASDSTYAMAFLRRAMAGSVGQMTMSNMYSVYKRYHKYVGNA